MERGESFEHLDHPNALNEASLIRLFQVFSLFFSLTPTHSFSIERM
jgi:hypothetical protein